MELTRNRSAADGRRRVGVVSVYFGLFDEQMPSWFRDERAAAAQTYVNVLETNFDVVYPGLLSSDSDGRRANEVLRGEELDAVVIAPSMAAPPTYALHAIRALDLPLIIWNAPTTRTLPPALSQSQATANTTQVGSVMIANALIREGRAFIAVTADPDDVASSERVLRTVSAVAAASSLRGLRALRVGDSMPGYLDVETTAEELVQLGISEYAVPASELNELFEASASATGDDWRCCADEASGRLASALSTLVERHGAACGTVNCHGPLLRNNARIGIPACFGVSLLTERGIPFSCTGDLPSAIAMLLARRLSGRSLYCEFYAPELDTGLMLLAAGGEGDPAWAENGTIRVEPNHHYPGARGEGAGLSFRIEPGPATVLSLSPVASGWSLAWATGEIVETRYPDMGGPNAMFEFDSGPSGEAGTRWIESGATHHNALARGRLDLEIPIVAHTLGIKAVRV